MTRALVVLTLALVAPSAAIEAAPFCSIALNPLVAGPLQSYFLGEATAVTVPASAGTNQPSGFGGHMTPSVAGDSIWGQYFTLDAAGGYRSDRFFDASRSRQQFVLVVFWDYDAGCEVTHYGGPRPMVVAGETVVVTARLRDPKDWVGGVPTLDTYWGGAEVFPITATSAWRALPPLETSLEDDTFGPEWDVPTVGEAWDFISMVSPSCEDVADPDAFASKVANVRAVYGQDVRFLIRHAVEGLDREVEWLREACIADFLSPAASINGWGEAPFALLLLLGAWYGFRDMPAARRRVGSRLPQISGSSVKRRQRWK